MSLEFLKAEHINRKDLTLLADYLEKLPQDYENFDMDKFEKKGRLLSEVTEWDNLCGTAGCAVGHAPFVQGISRPKENEWWGEYSDRITFDKNLVVYKSGEHDDLWDFLFGSNWVHVDNTPQGAARRIRAVLKDHESCVKFIERVWTTERHILYSENEYAEFLDNLGV